MKEFVNWSELKSKKEVEKSYGVMGKTIYKSETGLQGLKQCSAFDYLINKCDYICINA
jgi:hypothetical protein